MDTWIGSYEAIVAGELQQTSGAIERIIGKKPIGIEEFFTKNPAMLAKV
ncbi:MAG: hypothetical protein AAF518_12845 [Spirochaetota bacterium]